MPSYQPLPPFHLFVSRLQEARKQLIRQKIRFEREGNQTYVEECQRLIAALSESLLDIYRLENDYISKGGRIGSRQIAQLRSDNKYIGRLTNEIRIGHDVLPNAREILKFSSTKWVIANYLGGGGSGDYP